MPASINILIIAGITCIMHQHPLLQFTALSGRRSVLERPLSGENGRPFLVNTPDIIGY